MFKLFGKLAIPHINDRSSLWWTRWFTLLFIAINGYFIANNVYMGLFVPIGLAVVWLAIFHIDILLLIAICFAPLSIALKDIIDQLWVDMLLPSEPILLGITVLMMFRWLYGKRLHLVFLKHPVSIAVLFYCAVMFVTALTSTMMLVSVKYFIGRLWFIVPCYFLAFYVIHSPQRIRLFLWLYIGSFAIVVVYSILHLSMYGLFNQKVSTWVMQPLFKDHTVYGAALAFIFPPLLVLWLQQTAAIRKWIGFGLVCLFIAGLVFSYTRAAWLSLIIAGGVWLLVLLRIRFWVFVLMVVCAVSILYVYSDDIIIALGSNKQDSSGDLTEHVKSVSNVSTDASNLERINRWNCALRMFAQKPLLGWGPGTYTFQYSVFQVSSELTIISTNQGDLGNAHSEYLGILAESGVLGLISLAILIVCVFVTAFRVYHNSTDKKEKNILLALILALITYLSHAFLNNFLDSVKIAVPFWCSVAALVATDIHQRKQIDKNIQ